MNTRAFRLSRKKWLWLLSAVLVICIGALTLIIPTSYLIETPGIALNVGGKIDQYEVIDAPGTKTYPDTSSLSMTTVALYGKPGNGATVGELLQAWWKGTDNILPMEAIYPKNVKNSVIDKQALADMRNSQDNAKVAALEYLGYKVPMSLPVTFVAKESHGYGKVLENDVIKTITLHGVTTKIDSYSELINFLSKVPPNTEVTLGIDRVGTPVSETFTTISVPGRSGSLLGLGISPKVKYPVKINIRVGNIGGPSAGLMFTLGIIDKLTPGKIAGNFKVAGTGTISMDAHVGPIGGIAQKMIGAREAGNTIFIAPVANCKEVTGHIPTGLHVYAVDKLTDALKVIDSLRNGKIPTGPTCPR